MLLLLASMFAAPGCARLFGCNQAPDKCESKGLSAAKDLETAPMWVPDPAEGDTSNCKAHRRVEDRDRLCAVGVQAGIESTNLALATARQHSFRDLERKLRASLVVMLDGTEPGGGKDLDTLAAEISEAAGKVAETWVSPNCTNYVLTELGLDDFMLSIESADLSPAARLRVEAGARAAFEE